LRNDFFVSRFFDVAETISFFPSGSGIGAHADFVLFRKMCINNKQRNSFVGNSDETNKNFILYRKIRRAHFGTFCAKTGVF